jgi:hypothetical protein
MEKEDARKQSREVLHECRKQVIRLHRKGVGVMQIAQQPGLSRSGVNAALRLFEQGGAGALKPHARGKKPGTGRSLTPEQERAIQAIVIDKRPEQIKDGVCAVESARSAPTHRARLGDQAVCACSGRLPGTPGIYAPAGRTPVMRGGSAHLGQHDVDFDRLEIPLFFQPDLDVLSIRSSREALSASRQPWPREPLINLSSYACANSF